MNTKTMRRVLLSAVVAALLSGCLSVYKAEIQQGNSVSQEMIDKLRPGMTRSQVRFILGTPLITDPFHLDRWDYYYYIRRQGEDIAEVRRLTVIFKNDVLVAVEGDAPGNGMGHARLQEIQVSHQKISDVLDIERALLPAGYCLPQVHLAGGAPGEDAARLERGQLREEIGRDLAGDFHVVE